MKAKVLMAAWVAAIIGLFGHTPARAETVPQPQTAAEQIIDTNGTLYDGADEWA